MATHCSSCHHDNPDGTVICMFCGYVLDTSLLIQSTETRNLGETDAGRNQPRWGTARFDEESRLIIRVTNSGKIIEVDDAQKSSGVLLGRYNPSTKVRPDVDLSGFNAEESGVSREHARLNVIEGSLYITDLNSANHTFLNGLRLTANQPRILRDGDEIRLGRLRLQITFISSIEDY